MQSRKWTFGIILIGAILAAKSIKPAVPEVEVAAVSTKPATPITKASRVFCGKVIDIWEVSIEWKGTQVPAHRIDFYDGNSAYNLVESSESLIAQISRDSTYEISVIRFEGRDFQRPKTKILPKKCDSSSSPPPKPKYLNPPPTYSGSEAFFIYGGTTSV